MKIGLLAYSSDTGLGNQCWEFYKHMKPHKTLLVDLSDYNKMPTHHYRYPDAKIHKGYPDSEALNWLTDDVDIVFVCETPLNYELYNLARQKGVKTVQQYNYEFLDYFEKPDLVKPDVLAAPTAWNIDVVKNLNLTKVKLWRVPINIREIQFRKINECKTFVHIIGRPAVKDRNGTLSFLQAAMRLGREFKYKIYVQPPTDKRAIEYYEPVRLAIIEAQREIDIEVIENVKNYRDLYSSGDVLVFPRRYGGLCLPAQEAMAAGMPVIMTDVSPNDTFIPRLWRVRANKIGSFYAHVDVDVYEADIDHLVEVMKEFRSNLYIQYCNKLAYAQAFDQSWEKGVTVYQNLFRETLNNE